MSKKNNKRAKQEKAWKREAAKREACITKSASVTRVINHVSVVDSEKQVLGDMLPSNATKIAASLGLDVWDDRGWEQLRKECELEAKMHGDLSKMSETDITHAIANLCDEFYDKVGEFRKPWMVIIQGLPNCPTGYSMTLQCKKYGVVKKEATGIVICEDGNAYIQLLPEFGGLWKPAEMLHAALVEFRFSLIRAATAVMNEQAA